MSGQQAHPDLPDVSKSITVPVPVEEAFRIFVERPIEWLPAAHTFLKNPRAITMEPGVGGRFVERAADGAEAVRGTIVEWVPPVRLVVTWRIGANWRPTVDDGKASRIKLTFTEAGPAATEVVLTHTELGRHGEFAASIRSALDVPGPGESLARYAEVVARYAGGSRP